MRIETQMDVEQLRDRMGEATNQEAESMRDLLTESEYRDTSDIPESEWLAMLDTAVND